MNLPQSKENKIVSAFAPALILWLLIISLASTAQTKPDLSAFNAKGKVKVTDKGNEINVSWPVGGTQRGNIKFDMRESSPLITAMQLINGKQVVNITESVDPSFIMTIGKRDLVSQNGWNIFFDKVPSKPFSAHVIKLVKDKIAVASTGSRTVIRIGSMTAADFKGTLEITLYNGSPLLNIAAVMSTQIDSTAIIYDAGLVTSNPTWSNIAWANVDSTLERRPINRSDTATNHKVKYRSIIGENKAGSIAIFPAPHQYFYPLDEAFNLAFTWSGKKYRSMFEGYGIGIRQELYGDKRYVPWFNAPPKTNQRLNFFCLLSANNADRILTEVKRYTNSDQYPQIEGYKRFASHFHNEYVMSVLLAGKPVPDTPNFVKVFKQLGVDIVHLGEFHYTAHPKGPDEQRLNELDVLFRMCRRYSATDFLLLPGEEPNEFFGGHWLQFFPKPVYWIMSRAKDIPFVSQHPQYGKVYRIADKDDMLKLLETEAGLAWTAHPRTKGSTGYPDKYKSEQFFKSSQFMGAAWKSIPADLSVDRLGIRVLDLIDDMNNWGFPKRVIAEADLFTIEPENEMYAHMNVNYLKMEQLPNFDSGWKPVIDVLQKGQFFSSTGEVLIPGFTVNGAHSGDTVMLSADGNAKLSFSIKWTFPLASALIVSGDGARVFKERIDLTDTQSFGQKEITRSLNLKGRKWVRLEVWDAAVNGAFTQTIWLK